MSEKLLSKDDMEVICIPNESNQIKKLNNPEISEILQNSFVDLIRYSQTFREKIIQEDVISSFTNQFEMFTSSCNIKLENTILFFRLLKNEKIEISSDQFCDLYRLSEFFHVDALTPLLKGY